MPAQKDSKISLFSGFIFLTNSTATFLIRHVLKYISVFKYESPKTDASSPFTASATIES